MSVFMDRDGAKERDSFGRLPLHCAAEAGASAEVMTALVVEDWVIVENVSAEVMLLPLPRLNLKTLEFPFG